MSEKLTVEKVLQMFAETDRKIAEVSELQKETDRQINKMSAEVERVSQQLGVSVITTVRQRKVIFTILLRKASILAKSSLITQTRMFVVALGTHTTNMISCYTMALA